MNDSLADVTVLTHETCAISPSIVCCFAYVVAVLDILDIKWYFCSFPFSTMPTLKQVSKKVDSPKPKETVSGHCIICSFLCKLSGCFFSHKGDTLSTISVLSYIAYTYLLNML